MVLLDLKHIKPALVLHHYGALINLFQLCGYILSDFIVYDDIGIRVPVYYSLFLYFCL